MFSRYVSAKNRAMASLCFCMDQGVFPMAHRKSAFFQNAHQAALEDLTAGGDQLRLDLGLQPLCLALGLSRRLLLLAFRLAALLILPLLLSAAGFILQLLPAFTRLVFQLLLPLSDRPLR